jgi:hypothetical protein
LSFTLKIILYLKQLSKDKLEAFEQGTLNIPFVKKHLSKKEQEDLKKKVSKNIRNII